MFTEEGESFLYAHACFFNRRIRKGSNYIQPPEKNTPPLNMEYFHNLSTLVAESANDESLADSQSSKRF
jgi:predicted ribosome quality control (RQC) complex YloA/Tae2 family protein